MIDKDNPHAGHQDESSTGKEERAAAERLIRQAGRYVRLLHITHEAIICIDEDCRILIFNQGAERMFGYDQKEVTGTRVQHLLCPRFRSKEKHRLSVLTRIARDNHIGFNTGNIVCKRKNGDRFPAEVSLSQTTFSGQHLYTLVAHNLSERLRAEEQLAHAARHDELTDLPNRTLLNDRLSAGIARAERYQRKLGVVYLDLDDFKPINDHYGHETGDCLLQAVAKRLRDTMRQSDTVSRIGGDEFIVSLEQIKGAEDALAAAGKLDSALRQPFSVLGKKINISASIGISLYPDHGSDPATLLRCSDEAMYTSKSSHLGPQLFR
ncbi:PAS domain S-box-containing protein/diguanylate cyclase (GGDEF)-like protein [Thiogranum longum]|uniref:PAS domain S-box-containing protein/diguanylate cyclase (GGDEF)-like protein n=1 Tax=Thiogranum longum TaxID=1537524 RepID=A0A4V6NDA8_9GAMM|nr:sensor domain-containing diguanylate cyclase [Thiogranum longum]TCK17586.1 PAS domain S-box-containing protein/diguanylate cyclase (GGDEF)-like protein [Thiogranum longum]